MAQKQQNQAKRVKQLEHQLDQANQQYRQLQAQFNHYNEVIKVLKSKIGDKEVTIASHELTMAALRTQLQQYQEGQTEDEEQEE